MDFDWDEKKNQKNIKDHRISFEEAKSVFFDAYRLEFEDSSNTEERYHVIGMAYGLLLFVVYTLREVKGIPKIRIISARKADAYEKNKYFQNDR